MRTEIVSRETLIIAKRANLSVLNSSPLAVQFTLEISPKDVAFGIIEMLLHLMCESRFEMRIRFL